MTIEGWVYPTKSSGRRTLAIKETARGLAYALYPYGLKGRPSGHASTPKEGYAAGPKLRLRKWSHLAVTYDSATISTYVNGKLTGTLRQTGKLRTSTYPLRFGGNAVWREWFAGRLDEIRIYANALTEAQIQADMLRPIGHAVKGRATKAQKPVRIKRYRARTPHGA